MHYETIKVLQEVSPFDIEVAVNNALRNGYTIISTHALPGKYYIVYLGLGCVSEDRSSLVA